MGLFVSGLALFSTPAVSGEINWGRGSASGNFVGSFNDPANWDSGAVPGASDRVRCDRSGTVMTIDSTVVANDFLFGVNESGQTFEFGPNADVTLKANYFVAFNRGRVTATQASGANLTIGGSLILGQDDNPGHDNEDITVKLGGNVKIKGGIILGLRYNGDVSDVDLLVEISGSARADSILVANDEAHGGDKQAFLAPPKNNSAKVHLTPTGTLTLVGNKVEQAEKLVAEDILAAAESGSVLDIQFNGSDTTITASTPEPG